MTLARLAVGAAALLAAIAAAPVAAQAPMTAPPADFAAGALACGAALAPGGVDGSALARAGWTVLGSRGSVTMYQQDGRVVILVLSPDRGQCVVDGYAAGPDPFPAVAGAVRSALAAKHGTALKVPKQVVPNGQAFVVGDLMQVMSLEGRPGGVNSIRITGMRVPGARK